eukprot:38733-Rhodomonas_salina.1
MLERTCMLEGVCEVEEESKRCADGDVPLCSKVQWHTPTLYHPHAQSKACAGIDQRRRQQMKENKWRRNSKQGQ